MNEKIIELRERLERKYMMQMENAERKQKYEKVVGYALFFGGLGVMAASCITHPCDFTPSYCSASVIAIGSQSIIFSPPSSQEWCRAHDNLNMLEKLNENFEALFD